jgi:hypothetical protein
LIHDLQAEVAEVNELSRLLKNPLRSGFFSSPLDEE